LSVIAWDGHIIAADRQITTGGNRLYGHKIFQHGEIVIGAVGTLTKALGLKRWYLAGAKIEDMPEADSETHEGTSIIVISKKSVVHYYFDPDPVPIVGKQRCAWGCGKDLALGAMEMGADAIEAVKVACKYDVNCGMGVEWFKVR